MTLSCPHKQDSSSNILWLAFLFSVLLHLFLFTSLPTHFLTSNSIITSSNREKIIRVKKFQRDPIGQIVDIQDQKNIIKDPVESDFLSDRNRRVEKQTRALSTPKSAEKNNPAPQEKTDSEKPSKYNLKLTDNALRSATGNNNPQGITLSISSNYLPEISIGEETLLNTKEFAFNSFYIRMKREIEGYWRPDRVIYQIQNLQGTYITTVNVLLDDQGYLLQNPTVLKSSGIPALDREAVQSIEKSSPFPNPPKELLNEEGIIRVNWNFIFDRTLRM